MNSSSETEHLFSLDAWFKRKQMFVWHPCDSELGISSQVQDRFFKYGSKSVLVRNL